MKLKLTKRQHFIALCILLLGAPLALPLSLLHWVFQFGADSVGRVYDFVGMPFMALHRAWEIRCERVNAARELEKIKK